MSSKDMNSKEIIQEYIQSSFKKWNVMEDENIDPKVAELVKLPNGETVIFSYANIAITGTERKKPQIRVFLHEFKHVLNYAKEKNYRFFLFTIFSKSQSMAKGLNAFDPHEYIVSLETNLDNETSRRDLRSLYDFVQTYVGNGGMSKFIRCPKESHNAGINQASFIYIGNKNNREKKFFEDYITYFDNRPYMQSAGSPAFNYNTTEFEDAYDLPVQIIYYGVPGCGKSHTVDEEINKAINEYNEGKTDDDKISYEDQVTRVVFHPDYGNADFIGQIMPKIRERGGVDYIFKPGPFSQILRKAYLNSSKPYFLVIEEINRGNAAAIFGEMFQLLDRIKDNKKDKNGYGPGWSSYSILNDDVNDYIRDIKAYEKSDHSGCMKANHPKDMLDGNGNPVDSPDANGKKEIDFSTATSYCSLELILQGFDSPQIFRESTAIRLPPNLSIYATMNTSDQNVFTLDNAFQRRWEMKQVPNKLRNSLPENATDEQKKDLEAEIAQYDESIGETNVKWGVFRDEINKIIMRSAEDNGLSSMEDKRLGGWFIVPKKPDEKEDSKAVITKQAFAEKVLKYLWDDAFKFDRNSHFNFNKDEEPTLEKLIENFDTKEFEVFIDPKIRELQKKTPSGDSPQNAATKEQ